MGIKFRGRGGRLRVGVDLFEEIGRDGGEMADGSVKQGRSIEVWLSHNGPAGTENVMVEPVVGGGDLQTIESDGVAMGVARVR